MRCLAAIISCAVFGVAFAQPTAADFNVTAEFTGSFVRTTKIPDRAPRVTLDSVTGNGAGPGGNSTSTSGGPNGRWTTQARVSRQAFLAGASPDVFRTNTANYTLFSRVENDGLDASELDFVQSSAAGQVFIFVHEPVILSIDIAFRGSQLGSSGEVYSAGDFLLMGSPASLPNSKRLSFQGTTEQTYSWDLVIDGPDFLLLDFSTSAYAGSGSGFDLLESIAELNIQIDVRSIPMPGTAVLFIPGLVASARRRR